jgi:hypothetical protein
LWTAIRCLHEQARLAQEMAHPAAPAVTPPAERVAELERQAGAAEEAARVLRQLAGAAP